MSSINGVGKMDYPHAKERNWTIISLPIQRSSQKYTKDLNVRPETVKLLE